MAALGCIVALGWGAMAQTFESISMPTDVCAGSTTMVTIGFNLNSTAVLALNRATRGHSDTIFLPDGPPCFDSLCSYHSSVSFVGFPPGATVTSVEDIKYVRLNIEHSFLGDIYIGLTCPNNQHATIKYVASGIPACLNIPHDDSVTHPHGGGRFFGIPLDTGSGDSPCDPSAELNEPGIGWNYCWSDRSIGRIGYAPGAGSLVATAPLVDAHTVDSSNVAAMTNFFHPDGGFASLVGCPLNGVWTIDVVDVWSVDNGYLFNWDITLDNALMQQDTVICIPYFRSLTGPFLQTVNDSLYYIHWPSYIAHDSTVAYTFRLIGPCNDTVDTTINVTIHPKYMLEQQVNGTCPVEWDSVTYTDSTVLTYYSHSMYGCDSITRLAINVLPAYDTTLYDTVVENELPLLWNGEYINEQGVYLATLTTANGCDSLVRLWLHVYYNNATVLDSTVCYDALPLVWNGVTFDTTDANKSTVIEHILWLENSNGADSMVIMRLTVLPVYDEHLYDTVYGGQVEFGGVTYGATGTYVLHMQTAAACDSTVTLHLQIWPRTVVDSIICQDQLPLLWNELLFDDREHTGGSWQTSDSVHLGIGVDSLVVLNLTVYDTSFAYDILTCCDSLTWRNGVTYRSNTYLPAQWLHNQWGCDSLSGLELTVYRSAAVTLADTFCYGQTYHWRGLMAGDTLDYGTQHFTLSDTLATTHRCDSVVTINLLQLGRPQISFQYEPNCETYSYSVAADVSVDWGDGTVRTPYFRWSSVPYDPLLDGHEVEGAVSVTGGATYYVYADYTENPLCPATATLRLNMVARPHAELHVTPNKVKYERRDFDAYDATPEAPYSSSPDSALQWSRQWFIDWVPVARDSSHLHYEATVAWPDSVLVGLVLYNGICYDTAIHSVPYIRKEMWVPNAFTPGRDDNNRFVIIGIGIIEGQLYVYNREGLLVYHTDDYTDGWDGRDMHGRPCLQGSYVWKLVYRAVDYPSAHRSEVGTVTLIR